MVPPDPPSTAGEAARSSAPRRRRAMWVLAGCASWLYFLAIVLPAIELGLGGWLSTIAAGGFPGLVAIGLALDAAAFDRGVAARRGTEAILFGLAPLALVGALATRDDLAARDVLGPAHVALLTVASGAYLAAVAHLASTHARRRLGRPEVLPPASRSAAPRAVQAIRNALLGLVFAGSVALVAVAPVWSGHAARLARHGVEGAETAALLATVIALATSVTSMTAVVAPALRARPASDAQPRRLAPLRWAVLGASIAALYAWLELA